MSDDHARKFVEKLKDDEKFRERFLGFMKKEGFNCTIEELTRARWESLIATHYSEPLHARPNLPASEHWD